MSHALALQAAFLLADTRWRLGSRVAETHHSAKAHTLYSGSSKTKERRHISSSSDEEVSPLVTYSWPIFWVTWVGTAPNAIPSKPPRTPVCKATHGVCGEVKKVVSF